MTESEFDRTPFLQKNRLPGWVHDDGYDRDLALRSVGNGWSTLINEVFDMIDSMDIKPFISQVKEKFGGLRIYTYNPNHADITALQTLLHDVERRSFTMCEQCGAPGKSRGKHWIYTACDEHEKTE